MPCSPAQISQVFLNLLINADAGAWRPTRNGDGRIGIATRAEAGAVVVEVADNGGGIPRAVLPRIFDPFFTTKPVGEGTGLGLSITPRHRRRTTAAGSRSRAPPARGPASASSCPSGTRRRDGTMTSAEPPHKHCLLVVDDEPDVCDSVHDLLRREFRVLQANSAAEAVRLMQEEEVHIIMTDQRMPQVTGVEMLPEGQGATIPQAIRMLFTGYADLESVIAAINQGHVYQFLKKPWQPEDLEAAVAEAAAEYDRLVERERILQDCQERVAKLEAAPPRHPGPPRAPGAGEPPPQRPARGAGIARWASWAGRRRAPRAEMRPRDRQAERMA